MSIKVKEVLELAQSKGCTLAAGEGGIDRIVRFVDCMEIPDMKAHFDVETTMDMHIVTQKKK